MDTTYRGSAICSYKRRTLSAILKVTVPATIITSDCRGLASGGIPNLSMSYGVDPALINSIAQHAKPNVMGNKEDNRDQFNKSSKRAMITPPSPKDSL